MIYFILVFGIKFQVSDQLRIVSVIYIVLSYDNVLNSTDLVLYSLSIVNSQGRPDNIND